MADRLATVPERVAWPADEAGQARLVERAVALLRAGEAVAFPTDTVYGIGALDRARLFAIKRRPPEKAIAALVAAPEMAEQMAEQMAEGLSGAARALVARYWPGALTVVVRQRGVEGGAVGLRMPDHPVPLAIIRRLGEPLTTTSANLAGGPSPRTADDVLAQLPSGYPLLIDGGPCPGGVDSTVIDLTGEQPRLLRAGGLPRKAVEAILGSLAT